MKKKLLALLRRLENVTVTAYGVQRPALNVIAALSDEELSGTLEQTLEAMLQEGRYIEE